jgi:Abortive infection C-terminus
VPKVFSPSTLEKFEAASASIPLRPLDRAFQRAEIRLGDDPGGPAGSRRTQFRRYVASLDQRDPQQRKKLSAALGALVAEVATSKVEFLVKAAERDGFVFAEGVFREAKTAPSSFAVTTVEDLVAIEDRGRRLRVLADDSPKLAIEGAKELVESVCRTALSLAGKPASAKKGGLVELSTAAGKALDLVPASNSGIRKDAALIRQCLRELASVVAGLGQLRTPKNLSPRQARLAVGAAVTFAAFLAETYAERAASPVRQ